MPFSSEDIFWLPNLAGSGIPRPQIEQMKAVSLNTDEGVLTAARIGMDQNVQAFRLVQGVMGSTPDADKTNRAAGDICSLKDGVGRSKVMTNEQRRRIASLASRFR